MIATTVIRSYAHSNKMKGTTMLQATTTRQAHTPSLWFTAPIVGSIGAAFWQANPADEG